MIRRLGFGFVLVTAFIVAACGRQVSPNPPGFGAGGAPPGFMSVKFDVANTFNFQSYQYWVAFNTSGNGQMPWAGNSPQQTNWKGYSTALEVGGNGATTYAYPIQFVKNSNPVIPPHFQVLGITPQLFQYTPDSNGTGTEFTILMNRVIFTSIVSPAPSPSASPAFSNVWLFNGFTTQANGQNQLIFIDSMGTGGATDTTFTDQPPLNINTCFDNVYIKQQDINPPQDAAAQIVSIEIANNPSPGPHSSPCSS